MLIDTFCTLSNRHHDVETIDDSITGSFQQIDFNRHLERIIEVAQNISVKIVREAVLKRKIGSDILNILRLWESFNDIELLADSSGKFF